MIKARDLIKSEVMPVYFSKDRARDINLLWVCKWVSNEIYYSYRNFNCPSEQREEEVHKLAKRLEREFLRGEKEAKKQELGQNEALLKVRVVDFEKDIHCIEKIKLHVIDTYFLNIKDHFNEYAFNSKPFNKNGIYLIKGVIDEYDDGLFCNKFWDFEVIDFKPLEVI